MSTAHPALIELLRLIDDSTSCEDCVHSVLDEGEREEIVTLTRGVFTAGRRQAGREILARARALQADIDGGPNLAADPMVAGEVEGLWSAVRIADEETWQAAHDKTKREVRNG